MVSIAHESFLVHRRFHWLKISIWLVLASIVAYAAWQPADGRNSGSTWLGYGLGTIGALIIVWLMLFGVRKRRYGPGAWSLKSWLSAHVYLGLSLIVVATLHCAFEFGWNIHTLAYVLMIVVILTGVIGIITYARVPTLMTNNRLNLSLEGMAREMLELDREAAELAIPLGDEYVQEVQRSRDGTRLGGSLWRQLSARDPNCATAKALARVRELAKNAPPGLSAQASALLVPLGRKDELLRRARRDIRYKALMDLWLMFHVPLSFALLAALTAHIISVFFYW